MVDDPVRIERNGGTAMITLNRPDRRNALSAEVEAGFETALDAVDEPETRCLVITGSGGAFSAGGDIERMRLRLDDSATDDIIRSIERRTDGLIGRVHRFPVPTIAALDGPAVGAGAGLALACDLRLTSDRAKIGFGFRQVGLTCDAGTSLLLPRLVGPSVAKELLLTGDLIGSEEALEMGLVNHVYPTEDFETRVSEFATIVAEGPTVALRQAMRLIDDNVAQSLAAALRDEATAQGIAIRTEDHAEGVAAFLDGREPSFDGR